MKFEISDVTLGRLKEHKDFMNDRPSKKKGEKGEAENAKWQELRAEIYEILDSLRGKIIMSREEFLKTIEVEFEKKDMKVTKKISKIIWQEIGERDEKAEICADDDGEPVPDNELKDFERVPWGRNIRDYFEKEIRPYTTDAWVDESVCDEKDGQLGIVGYEIPFTRYFYKYEEPRKLEDIESDIKAIELLHEKRAALINRAVTKGLDLKVKLKPSGVEWLGEIPEGWELRIFKGLFKASHERVKDDPSVELALSVSGYRGVVPRDVSSMEGQMPSDDVANYRIVRKGQLVVNTMWLNFTGLGVSEYEGYVSPAYCSYDICHEINPRFAHHLLRSPLYVQKYSSMLYGVRPNSLQVKSYDFERIEILFPPAETQRAIADYLDVKTAEIDKVIENIESHIEKLKEYRSSLIYSAVTGKITI